MKRFVGLFAIFVTLAACGGMAEAQQPKKVPRIGYLTASSAGALANRTEAFRQGLRDLGYVEGKNIVIEYRYGDGQLDRVPTLATANPTQPLEWKGIQAAAVTLGLKLQSLNVRSGADLDVAFEAALKQRAQALINLPEAIFTMNVKRITEFATKNKLPAMCTNPQSVSP